MKATLPCTRPTVCLPSTRGCPASPSTTVAWVTPTVKGRRGTSQSTLLRAITAEWGIPLLFVEGNADLTPSRLVGHHNPARVLREDYSADNFVPGPLVQAMRTGGFLYVEEFNRAPED